MVEIVKPAITVYWQGPLFTQQMMQQLAEGMEEEGIPYRFLEQTDTIDAIKLATQAAKNSQLEVGIGMGAQGDIAIQHRRLPDTEPLFQASWPHSPQELRILGGHAARLVKGLPLKLDTTQYSEREYDDN